MTSPISSLLPGWMNELTLASVLIRVTLAIACGSLLGIERERKRRPAGFRTYMLVCVGAALVMMTNQYMFSLFESGDVARLGAQVISGIGFLGAGTIIITGRNRISGLTTAAGLWASACIGLAIGIGFYFGGILCTLLMYLIMAYLHKLDIEIGRNSENLNLYIELHELSNLGAFLKYAKHLGYHVSNVEVAKADSFSGALVAVLLTVTTHNHDAHSNVVKALEQAEGVIQIEEI